MAAFRRRVPIEDLVVVICVSFADARIIKGAPELLLDLQSALARPVDETSKTSRQAVFHGLSNGAKTLRVRTPLGPDRFQPPAPLCQNGVARTCHVGEFRTRQRRCEGTADGFEEHRGIVRDNAVEPSLKDVSQVHIVGKRRLER